MSSICAAASSASCERSIVRALLPAVGSKESVDLNKATRLPQYGQPKHFSENYNLNGRLGRLFLIVAQETALALIESRYTAFDAIVKNYGCQMTAVEVSRLVCSQSLRQEAQELNAFVSSLLALEVHKIQARGVNGQEIADYLKDAMHFDKDVSPEMARLLRLRLLCIVNTNVVKIRRVQIDGAEQEITEEAPVTVVGKLYEKITKSKKQSEIEPLLNKIVNGAQSDESRKAIAFTRGVASELLQKGGERAALLNKLVSPSFERNTDESEGVAKPVPSASYERQVERYVAKDKRSIASIPLMYNTEAVIRSIAGIILVKNKLLLCGKEIPNALANRVFLVMPQEQILSEDEVQKLDEAEPVVVVEGFMKNETQLAQQIKQLGLIAIINANCAKLPQYASGIKNTLIKDDDAEKDLAAFAQNEAAASVMRIDHIYCASVKEER